MGCSRGGREVWTLESGRFKEVLEEKRRRIRVKGTNGAGLGTNKVVGQGPGSDKVDRDATGRGRAF